MTELEQALTEAMNAMDTAKVEALVSKAMVSRDNALLARVIELVDKDLASKIFVDNGDGTVTDKFTMLMWQRDDLPNACNWADADKYAKSLALGGNSDWRLPSKDELISLWGNVIGQGSIGPRIKEYFFPRMYFSYYWSSTPSEYDSPGIWCVSFDLSGASEIFSQNGMNYTRCVRLGSMPADSPKRGLKDRIRLLWWKGA